MDAVTAEQVRELAERRCDYQQSIDIVAYRTSRQISREHLQPAEFDPIDVPALLRFLYLLERHEGRLRYRVSGEAVNSLFERQHTGRYRDEVVPPRIHQIVAPCFERVFDGTVCLFQGDVVLPNRDFLRFERVLLPVRRQERLLLLGCLSLSNTARPRANPSPVRSDGFHFTVYDLASGATEERHVQVAVDSFRRGASATSA